MRTLESNTADSPAAAQPSGGLGFALAHLLLAGLTLFGVFGVLDQRWWGVDVPAGALSLLLIASAVGFLRRDAKGLQIARIAAWVVLLLGAVTFATLCFAAAFVAGVQGVLGKGVAMAYLLLILPVGTWFVVLPAVELRWIRRQRAALR